MELERDVEGYLVRRVEGSGGQCIKHGQDGWPDRIVTLPGGRVVWVELKRSGGRVAELQKYRAAQLRNVGQIVRTVWSKAEVDELLQEMSGESE